MCKKKIPQSDLIHALLKPLKHAWIQRYFCSFCEPFAVFLRSWGPHQSQKHSKVVKNRALLDLDFERHINPINHGGEVGQCNALHLLSLLTWWLKAKSWSRKSRRKGCQGPKKVATFTPLGQLQGTLFSNIFHFIHSVVGDALHLKAQRVVGEKRKKLLLVQNAELTVLQTVGQRNPDQEMPWG